MATTNFLYEAGRTLHYGLKEQPALYPDCIFNEVEAIEIDASRKAGEYFAFPNADKKSSFSAENARVTRVILDEDERYVGFEIDLLEEFGKLFNRAVDRPGLHREKPDGRHKITAPIDRPSTICSAIYDHTEMFNLPNEYAITRLGGEILQEERQKVLLDWILTLKVVK